MADVLENKVPQAAVLPTPPSAYVFDPAKTRVIILTWPDNAITIQALDWLWRHWAGHRRNIIAHCQRGFYDVVRCQVVQRHCLSAPKEIEQFVFMDRDMRPDEASTPVLTTPGDVVGCPYQIGSPRGWANPTTIHMGLVRVRREVLTTLSNLRDEQGKVRPLFFFPRTPDNSGMLGCECAWFSKLALEAGFSVTRAGWCGHKDER